MQANALVLPTCHQGILGREAMAMAICTTKYNHRNTSMHANDRPSTCRVVESVLSNASGLV